MVCTQPLALEARMPVYKLEPVESLADHDAWRMSGIGAMAVWVRAQDEDEARQKIHMATIATLDQLDDDAMVPGGSPWLNSAVVACDEDDTRDVPDGVALLGNGATITL
jgi:hypothetical protein